MDLYIGGSHHTNTTKKCCASLHADTGTALSVHCAAAQCCQDEATDCAVLESHASTGLQTDESAYTLCVVSCSLNSCRGRHIVQQQDWKVKSIHGKTCARRVPGKPWDIVWGKGRLGKLAGRGLSIRGICWQKALSSVTKQCLAA